MLSPLRNYVIVGAELCYSVIVQALPIINGQTGFSTAGDEAGYDHPIAKTQGEGAGGHCHRNADDEPAKR